MKGAIAIAQEHAGIGGAKIRGHNVEPAIAVHIAQGQGAWVRSRVDSLLAFEGAIAIANEHGNGGVRICRYDVQLPIAVQIAQGDGELITAC